MMGGAFRLASTLVVVSSMGLFGCSTAGKPNDVLEPLETPPPPKAEAGKSEVLAETAPPPASPTVSPAFQRLNDLLQTLGYQGVGLQYESETTLDLLFRTFSDPKAAGRMIRLIYTGLQLTYDGKHQSLTIGGTSDLNTILSFIQKKVPQAKRPTPTAPPSP